MLESVSSPPAQLWVKYHDKLGSLDEIIVEKEAAENYSTRRLDNSEAIMKLFCRVTIAYVLKGHCIRMHPHWHVTKI